MAPAAWFKRATDMLCRTSVYLLIHIYWLCEVPWIAEPGVYIPQATGEARESAGTEAGRASASEGEARARASCACASGSVGRS